MKCQRCGKEMRNTIGGCYHCDECGFDINDLVYRGGEVKRVSDLPEYMQEEIIAVLDAKQNTTTTTTDGLATPSNVGTVTTLHNVNYGFAQQGWQCPKCGAILSPSTPFCPFCSRQTFTPTITCGVNGSGDYINTNFTKTISKKEG